MNGDESSASPRIDLTTEELDQFEKVAASKGYDLWIEPCGQCCDEEVIRIGTAAGLNAHEAAWFLMEAPNLLDGIPNPDKF